MLRADLGADYRLGYLMYSSVGRSLTPLVGCGGVEEFLFHAEMCAVALRRRPDDGPLAF